MKAKYVELVPRKHSKLFEDRHDAWKYWQKRFDKFYDYRINDKNHNPKDFFDAKVITLNKDGTPRKQTQSKPMTKKQWANQRKAHAESMQIRAEEQKKKNILRMKVEKKLNQYLIVLGYSGQAKIKYFRSLK